MSEWKPEVIRVGEVFPHPNKGNEDPKLRCDTLSYTLVYGGYPVLFRTGEFVQGDLAAYIPIDTVVPTDRDVFSFLKDSPRIKARRMRQMFSMGLLVPAPPGFEEGAQVVDYFGLEKYEPAEERRKSFGGVAIPGPTGWEFVKYTDIEGIRRYKNVLQHGEQVVITEKIHGTNARFCWDGEKLWVGSRTVIKKRDATTNWWHIANHFSLEEKLSQFPGIIFFGEIFGKSVQDLTYGIDHKDFLVFDTFDTKMMRYNDWHVTQELASAAGLRTVPILYEGPWLGFEEHKSLAEGTSTLSSHVREGYVVKPVHERSEHMGRVILKCIGEGYLLR